MITIKIDPIETHPYDGDQIVEQEQNPKGLLTKYILGIALILISVFGFLIWALS
jgi:hypothetical protein